MSYSKCVINRKSLLKNFEVVKKYCPNIIAMVKADAYGHGVKNVCNALFGKVKYFGVACLYEALQIRKFDKNTKILIVGFCENYLTAIKNNISFTIENIEDFENLLKIIKKNKFYLEKYKKIANIHLKINTGMNRLGFKREEDFENLIKLYLRNELKNFINIEGVFTHFASKKTIKFQLNTFKNYINLIPSAINPIIHIGGSIGKIEANFCKNIYLRVGIDLYTNPYNVMSIESVVLKIQEVKNGDVVGYDFGYKAEKNEKIAIIPLGYADGINRKTSGSYIQINSKSYRIVGNICMDMFFVLVDDSVKRFDKVIINFKNWDKKCKTINYEILTSINHRRLKDVCKY